MFRENRFAVLAGFLLTVTLGGYLLMAARFPMAYLLGTYEDLYGEWLQFYLFAAALLFSLRVVFSPSRYRPFFAVLALACLYVIMEEISWGQRIFGWSSPEFFRERNLQGETNLHNLLVGPVRTSSKSIIEYLLAGALLVYGVLYPALLSRGNAWARRLDGMGLAAPPLCLWPYFAAAAYLELGPFMFNEAEVAEVVLGLALTATAVRYSYGGDGHRASDGAAARALLVCVALAGTLSAATTLGLNFSPRARAGTEKRLQRGTEKFARRYVRNERWREALFLYRRLEDKDPESAFIKRRLADTSRRAGDLQAYRHWAGQALALDLERFEEDPSSPALNRSLVRTYRLLENEEKALDHLRRALDANLRRVEKEPGSARAAYSLARSYELQGNVKGALGEYRRAHELNPSSGKYRRAWLKAGEKSR